METPFQDLLILGLPLSRFRDEPTSPQISLAALLQWYEDSCLRSLDDIRKYHPPLLIPPLS